MKSFRLFLHLISFSTRCYRKTRAESLVFSYVSVKKNTFCTKIMTWWRQINFSSQNLRVENRYCQLFVYKKNFFCWVLFTYILFAQFHVNKQLQIVNFFRDHIISLKTHEISSAIVPLHTIIMYLKNTQLSLGWKTYLSLCERSLKKISFYLLFVGFTLKNLLFAIHNCFPWGNKCFETCPF